MSPQDSIYRFGAFELRCRSRELYKHGQRIRLRPQAVLILEALAGRPGEVVTREELRQLLWPAQTFVDFEHGLNNTMKELRGALGDSASEPRYIETLPKVGYRLLVPSGSAAPPGNTVAFVAPAPLVAAEASPAPAEIIPRAAPRAKPSWVLAAILGAVLIAGLSLYWRWGSARARLHPPSGRIMLAVLPFENLTGDPAQEYLTDGFTEEIITQLSSRDPDRIAVIARTSVMRFKHGVVPLAQAAGDLGVQYILEGSVRRDGAKVRIAAQLIQVKDETHLWAREYDRDLSDLLALQSEIARQTADELLLTLGSRGTAPQAAAARTPSPEAYNLYLKGLYSWNKRTHTDLRQAIQYFQRSVAVDPGYARAYVGLADGYSLIGGYSLTPQTEYMPKARAAALRALELDPTLAEAHTALALVVQNYDWDWQAAEKEFRRAIELNPNYATAHHWYAEHLMWRGRFDEALAESELARQLDPLSLIILADKAVLLYCARQYDRSIAQFRAVLELEPYFPRAHGVISPYVEKGMTAEALAEVEKSREHYGELPYIWAERAYIYARAGQTTQARRAVAVLEQFNRRQPVGPELMVWAYAGIGDKPRCMHWLEAAWKQHSNVMTALKVDPLFDGLRGDPRFQGLLHRVHLDQ